MVCLIFLSIHETKCSLGLSLMFVVFFFLLSVSSVKFGLFFSQSQRPAVSAVTSKLNSVNCSRLQEIQGKMISFGTGLLLLRVADPSGTSFRTVGSNINPCLIWCKCQMLKLSDTLGYSSRCRMVNYNIRCRGISH